MDKAYLAIEVDDTIKWERGDGRERVCRIRRAMPAAKKSCAGEAFSPLSSCLNAAPALCVVKAGKIDLFFAICYFII